MKTQGNTMPKNWIVRLISKIVGKVNSYITSLLVIFTLASTTSLYVSPETIKIFAYIGMAFPYILMTDIIYIILLFIAKKNSAFILIATVAGCYQACYITLQLNPIHIFDPTEDDPKDSSVKFMSFNVRLLDRYNWIKGKNDTKQKIFEFLKYEDPDIICFQEFYNNNKDSIDNKTLLKDLLQTEYVCRDFDTIEQKHNYDRGYIIFSKFKLYNRQYLYDGNNLIGISCDATMQKRKTRIFNIHLKSIKLGYDDYNFIDSINSKNNKEQISGMRNIFNKMNKAYSDRCRQAKMLDSAIKASPYPVVVCGDYNEPPVSYCYKTVKGDLNDAFCESGFGFGGTMRLKFLMFRIDYIMHSKSITSTAFNTHQEHLSDHYAISCKLNYKNE